MKNTTSGSVLSISRVRLFGEASRYRLERWESRRVIAGLGPMPTQWAVFDAERPDEDGEPSLIRQAFSEQDAVTGLE